MKNLALAILFGATTLLFNSCGESDPNNETAARVMVWQFVEGRLKSPGTAKFGSCMMDKTPDNTWKTSSYVDATNGFGGTERLYFDCEVKHKSNDSWELVELNID